ncbi:MAG: 16S rRNA (cytosine(967)-C(5))-methyltransferase RsmB [Oscillospiraceae bacterium]|nr:16S rRNA (cytosine(967)-C(5))-methyltransferase RsmB [Oscillospiraceae bacterium]
MGSKNLNINNINVREACLKSLVDYGKNQKYSNIELNSALNKYNFDDLNRSFFTKLFYGVIEKKLTLDFYIDALSHKKNKDPRVLNILRMGLYQFIYMDKVPDGAACGESVNLAKKLKNQQAAGYINAILRNFLRNREELEEKLNRLNNLEIKYSCSSDIIKIWEESYGLETAEKILKSSVENCGMTLAANALKISAEDYFDKLNNNNIEVERTEISPHGIIIKDNIPVKKIYGFEEGLFFVQDEASQICALETGAKPGDLVFDCCAAPGGKSFFIAGNMMKNKGAIICLDIHGNKLGLINSSAKRLGIDIIETYEQDVSVKFNKFNINSADVVLCDVPCSGLGVISKKPEIKYKSIGEISKLPKVQFEILSECSNYVKPGGTLVYSTCTLNKKENEEIIEKFLGTNKNFECINIKTFFPFERKIDGFFLAKMKRIGV